MEPLANVLEKSLKDRGGIFRRAKIFEAWPRAVEEKVSAVSSPEGLNGHTLTVIVKSSVWANQLSALKAKIIEKINCLAGAGLVRDLKFKVGKPEQIPKKEPPKIKAAKKAVSAEKIKSVIDENLPADEREIVEKIILKDMEREKELEEEGAARCVNCGRYFLGGEQGACPFCAAERKEEEEKKLFLLISAEPWIGLKEAQSRIPGLSVSEVSRLKQKLSGFWREQINFMGWRVADGDKDIKKRLRSLALSYTALRTGKNVGEIDEKEVERVVGAWICDILLENRKFSGRKLGGGGRRKIRRRKDR